MAFEEELRALINKTSAENASNTPDFILAGFLQSCLLAFDTAVQQRETWCGRDGRPTMAGTDIEWFGLKHRLKARASQND